MKGLFFFRKKKSNFEQNKKGGNTLVLLKNIIKDVVMKHGPNIEYVLLFPAIHVYFPATFPQYCDNMLILLGNGNGI